MTDLTPATLEGTYVRLEPLAVAHRSGLADVALDSELWRFTPTQIHSLDDLDAYIETALSLRHRGDALPFTTIDRATGRVIGSTRFGNIEHAHQRAEIGWTWLARAFQRKAFNTEAKLLMLEYAFEEMGWIRVELRADALNTKSRAAIVRLGAKEEGTLRQHMNLPDGRRVDWVYYSILNDEWPAVRAVLEARLRAHERA